MVAWQKKSDVAVLSLWICSLLQLSLTAPVKDVTQSRNQDGSVEKELLSLESHSLPVAPQPVKPADKISPLGQQDVASLPISPPQSHLEEQEQVEQAETSPVKEDDMSGPERVESLLPPQHGTHNVQRQPDEPMVQPARVNTYQQYFGSPAIDLTPQAVAEYLVLTSDFEGLDMALMDLVKSRILSLYEVERYREAVGLEYEKLLQQIVDAEASYLQAFSLLYGDDPMVNVNEQQPPLLQKQLLPQQQQQRQVLIQEPLAAAGTPAEALKVPPPASVKSVLEVGKVTGVAIDDQALSSQREASNNAELETDTGSNIAAVGDNKGLTMDKLIEWLNKEIENEPMVKEVQSVKVSKGLIKDGKPLKEFSVTKQKVSEPGKPDIVQTKTTKTDGSNLENRDNQGKMVIKEEVGSAA